MPPRPSRAVRLPTTLTTRDVLDTAVTIYDEAGNDVLASMDDAFPRYSTNTELVWRVPATGTYCFKVEDWASWAGEARPVDPTGEHFEYEIGLYTPNPDADGNAIDTEPNDDTTDAQAQTYAEILDGTNPTGIYYSNNYGTLESDSDVDVFAFTMPTGTVNLSTEDFTTPIGPGGQGVSGNGSTLELGLVSISDASGSIIAQLDAHKGSDQMSVPLEAGTGLPALGQSKRRYDRWRQRLLQPGQLRLERGQRAGNRDRRWRQQQHEHRRPHHLDDLDIGFRTRIVGTSSASSTTAATSTTSRSPLRRGDTVSMACGAVRSGSGLVDAKFAVNDTTDAELQSET